MTEAQQDYSPVLTHVVGPVKVKSPAITSINAYSVSVANVIADGQGGQPATRLLLPYAPNRCRTTLIITGTATDTAFLASTQTGAIQKNGAQVSPLAAPIIITGSGELWLAAGTGTSIVVGVIAEYYEND